MKTGNIFMKNSHFSKFSSNIIHSNSYFSKLNIVSSRFSNGLRAPIKISSEKYEKNLYYQPIIIESGSEHQIKDCYFYKINSQVESALTISIETSQNILIMQNTFYECSSVKAPGAISLDSKTNAYIINTCIQKSKTNFRDQPIFLLRPAFSYFADQVSISDSICNGSMINLESTSNTNKTFNNLNISKCNSHVIIYSKYKGEHLRNCIYDNNKVEDFLLSFLYEFTMDSIFVTGNTAKNILRFTSQSFDISNSIFSKNIFNDKFIIHYGPGIGHFINCKFDFAQVKLENEATTSCQFNVSEIMTANFSFDDCNYIPLPTQTPPPTSTPSQSLPPPTPTEQPPIIIGRDVFTLSTKIVITITALLVVAAILFMIFRRLCKRNHGEVQDNNYLADDLNTEDIIIPEA